MPTRQQRHDAMALPLRMADDLKTRAAARLTPPDRWPQLEQKWNITARESPPCPMSFVWYRPLPFRRLPRWRSG